LGSDRRRVCGRLTYAGQACTEPAPRVTLGLVARPVQSRNALTGALTEYSARPPEHRPKLYGFLLFDERESHRPVAAFAEDQLAWLDALAASANIVLFLFLRPEPAQAASGGDSQLVAVESAEAIENPSLRVAGALDVRPHELPGIVFFTRLNVDHGPNEGVYWPIPVELFEGNRRRAENDFAQLFSLVQEVLPGVARPDRVLVELEAALREARRARSRAPLLAALRDGLVRIVRFPGALIEAMGEAWATELARRMAPQ
jgi:hypothetical protein